MKANDLLDMIGDVDDDIIEEAKKRKKPVAARWTRWVAVAACIALVAGSILIITNVISRKGGPGQNDPLRPAGAIEYNGAYYEIVRQSNADKLDDYNLPHEITADMIGEKLGRGLDANGDQSIEEFYVYLPYADISTMPAGGTARPQRAVYLVSDDNEYSFALICGFVSLGEGSNIEAKEMFAVYGVDRVYDISDIQIGDNKLESSEEIKAFFSKLWGSTSDAISNLKDKDEDLEDIVIITSEGLVIRGIKYSDSSNRVYWGNSYYELN